ncbi:AraC family transcriptional regulator [Massilia sp. ST3]|uniref:AraC family transcriptional regulator n=1 Tax=Massilia sp. ST3 TaxID=2824903 RepID=UPI001B824D5A|nr:AraC family transcriptional regulator [Massilia sp. ST3]MBQ5950492.1 AraC family transcriptional regulator [Massilia sp. ST3]
MTTSFDHDILAQLCKEMVLRFAGVPEGENDLATGLPWLTLVRRLSPTAAGRGILQPSACLIVQGEKEMLVGQRVLRYGPGCYVQAGAAMPVSGRIVEASASAPYLGIRIDLDPKEVAAFILDMQLPVPPEREDVPVVTVEPAADALMETFLRLLRLLDRPRDLTVLGRLVKQEIMYHLITAPGGLTLSRGLLGGQREHAVSRAISWIREHYDQPLKISDLADTVHLSASVLHRRFKAATVMSPLQYQKQVRLLEARKLLMSGSFEAASVAYQVGYESPSQFSREYRRLFGASPLQDAQHLRGHAPEP